jgi:hypothetical protein
MNAKPAIGKPEKQSEMTGRKMIRKVMIKSLGRLSLPLGSMRKTKN